MVHLVISRRFDSESLEVIVDDSSQYRARLGGYGESFSVKVSCANLLKCRKAVILGHVDDQGHAEESFICHAWPTLFPRSKAASIRPFEIASASEGENWLDVMTSTLGNSSWRIFITSGIHLNSSPLLRMPMANRGLSGAAPVSGSCILVSSVSLSVGSGGFEASLFVTRATRSSNREIKNFRMRDSFDFL